MRSAGSVPVKINGTINKTPQTSICAAKDIKSALVFCVARGCVRRVCSNMMYT